MRFFCASSSCSSRSGHHVQPEVQEVPEHRVEIQALGPANLRVLGRDQGREIHDEAGLKRRVFEQVRHHHLLVGILLQLERDPHVFGRQILDVDERRQLAAERHVRDPLDQRGLVHRIRDARDVNRLAATRDGTLFPGGAQTDRAGSGFVDLFELLRRVQHLAAGREVRPFDVAAQLHAAQIRIVQQLEECGAHLPKIVRGDVRGHPHRNAGRAVDQQVRDARRQHDGLRACAVVVGPERHGRLIDFGEQLVAEAGQAALGVPHRGRAVAVERSEVAGSVDEGIPQRKRLRHPNERLIERGIAVRVVVAHHVTDDLGALAMFGVGGEILLPHRVEDAALDRLQPVAYVGKRPRGDDRERVVEIPDLRRFVERDRLRLARSSAAPCLHHRTAIVVKQRRVAFLRPFRQQGPPKTSG